MVHLKWEMGLHKRCILKEIYSDLKGLSYSLFIQI